MGATTWTWHFWMEEVATSKLGRENCESLAASLSSCGRGKTWEPGMHIKEQGSGGEGGGLG